MKRNSKSDNEDQAGLIEALLDEGEVVLWWDKFSDRSIVGGMGRTLIRLTLAVNAAILLLILLPSLLPGINALSWLLVPLLLVDCLCLLFIMLYFAFGLMTGGVNAITSRRVVVADVHRGKIVRSIAFDTLSEIRVHKRRDDRGDLLFLRDETSKAPATARHPLRLSMQGVRQFGRVVSLLSEQRRCAQSQ